MNNLAQQLRTFLDSLGSTPDEVAGSLRARGVKGSRCTGNSCPIANAIEAEFPGSLVFACPATIRVSTCSHFAEVDPGNACSRFMLAFDAPAVKRLAPEPPIPDPYGDLAV